MRLLSAMDVIHIHDTVIHPHELQGQAPDKSVEAVITRVLNRFEYGLIPDVFALAACYAAFIAVAHAFNDANKRTAFAAMDTILALNGVELDYGSSEEAGDMIVKAVLGEVDEEILADWLREKSKAQQRVRQQMQRLLPIAAQLLLPPCPSALGLQ